MKNALSEEFCITANAVQRGADTSSLWTPDGKYQGFFYIQYTRSADGALTYGCNWSPLWMSVGETYVRNAYIVEYWWDGRIKAQYPATTTLKFEQFHASYTFAKSGITVANVAELSWEGEEHYFYAANYGLVGWLNVRTGAGSYLGSLKDVYIRPPVSHPIPRPIVPPPPQEYPVTQPTIPAPTEGGVLSTLTTIPGAYVNVRPQPNSTVDSGDLLKGDVVKAYPPVNGWVYVEPVNPVPRPEGRQPAAKGWVSLQNGAVAFTPVPLPAAKTYTFTVAQLTELRRLTKQQNDTNAAIMALLDEGTLADSSGGF